MQGRYRNRPRRLSQYRPKFKQNDWGGGENSDVPPSKVGKDQLPLIENYICFPDRLETRSGTKRHSDTALPGSGTIHSYIFHPTAQKWALHRGTQVFTANAAQASWTEVTEYASGQVTPTIAGDTGSQLSSFFLLFANSSNTNAGVLYWSLTNSGSTRTLNIYKDSAKTQLVGRATGVGDGGKNVLPMNDSGLSGDVTITYSGDDTDSGNTFTVTIGASVGYNVDSSMKLIDNDVLLFTAPTTDIAVHGIIRIVLADNKFYSLNASQPKTVPAGTGSQAAATPYGYRYLYTYCRITNTSGAFDSTKNRLSGILVQETGSVRPYISSDNFFNDYGDEYWLANAISTSNAHSLTAINSPTNVTNTDLTTLGHFTHIGLYRTLDVGVNGVDPISGAGNNPEIYVWVGDYAIGSGTISDTKTDADLRASFVKGFGLKSRFFEPMYDGAVGNITSTFLFAARRGQPRVQYSQCAGDYKVHIGQHRRDVQFWKMDDGVQIIEPSPDILSIICSSRAYYSAYQNIESVSKLESVFAITHLAVADYNIGVTDYGSFAQIKNGLFIAVCSDRTIRKWNQVSWSKDLSEGVNKRVQIMIEGSVGAFQSDAYYLWYRTSSGVSYNNQCLRLGMGGGAGFGWSRMTGADWIFPPTYVGAAIIQDSSKVQKLIVLDSPGSAFYWVPPFLGYALGLSAALLTDKITTAGVAGTAIVPKFRVRELVGEEESHTITHDESHLYVRNWQGASTNDLSAVTATLSIYVDGDLSAIEDDVDVTLPADIQINKRIEGHFLLLEWELSGAGYAITETDTHLTAEDKRQVTRQFGDTLEGGYQTTLAGGTTLKHWLTRPKSLRNRANGRDYTLTGTAPTNVTGPDSKDYALSFVTGASYLQTDTTSYSDFTISFWVKDFTVTNRVLIITGSNSFYITFTNNTTMDINGAGNITVSSIASGWHHFVVVRNGSTVTVYQAGALLAGSVTVATARGGTSVTINPDAVAMKLFDIRIYNDNLAVGPILYLYTETNGDTGEKVLPTV